MRRYPSIRRCEHGSSYFLGGRRLYGRYQWDVKYNDFRDDVEIEIVHEWALGMRVGRGFEILNEIVGRPVECFFEGRSGGWLVIDTELTDDELDRVDEYIEKVMDTIPAFLKEMREERGEE